MNFGAVVRQIERFLEDPEENIHVFELQSVSEIDRRLYLSVGEDLFEFYITVCDATHFRVDSTDDDLAYQIEQANVDDETSPIAFMRLLVRLWTAFFDEVEDDEPQTPLGFSGAFPDPDDSGDDMYDDLISPVSPTAPTNILTNANVHVRSTTSTTRTVSDSSLSGSSSAAAAVVGVPGRGGDRDRIVTAATGGTGSTGTGTGIPAASNDADHTHTGHTDDDDISRPMVTVRTSKGTYSGQLRLHDRARHGRGLMIYYNNDKYTGFWQNDKREGYGTQTFSNGDVYEGFWVGGVREGHGKIVKKATGDVYTGDFHKSQCHGQGEYRFLKTGDIYSGSFRFGKYNGEGVYYYGPNGESRGEQYEGSFKNGLRHGYGVYRYRSGERFEGSFVDGLKCGRGVFFFTDGSRYDGEWKDDDMNGRGMFLYADIDHKDPLFGWWENGGFVRELSEEDQEVFLIERKDELDAVQLKHQLEELKARIRKYEHDDIGIPGSGSASGLVSGSGSGSGSGSSMMMGPSVVGGGSCVGGGILSLSDSDISWERMETLGRGGFGFVFKALDRRNGQLMAVKRVDVLKDENYEDLKREVEVLQRLSHRHIIRYLGCQERDKYASEGTIDQYFSKNFLDVASRTAAARIYFRQIILGLDFLHQANICHRDVKPSNILVTADGLVKLADFGCVAVLDKEEYMTSFSTRGTRPYFAPEFIDNSRGLRIFPKAIDIWALGLTMCELVTGKYLFKFDSNYLLLKRISELEVPPDIPDCITNEFLRDLILSCLQIDPEKRLTTQGLLVHPFFREEVEFHDDRDSDSDDPEGGGDLFDSFCRELADIPMYQSDDESD